MKKLLSLILAGALIISMVGSAFAAGGSGAIHVDDVTADPGAEIEVPIVMDTNPGVVALNIDVTYAEGLVLTGVDDGGLLGTNYFEDNYSKNPYTLMWNNGTSKENYTETGSIAILHFTVSEDAVLGSELAITLKAYDGTDVDLKDVDFTVTNGSVCVGGKYYDVTAEASENGSISPEGTVTVKEGNSQTFTITPDDGYHIEDVTVDNESVGAKESYTFSSVDRDHTITAAFAAHDYKAEVTEPTCTEGGYTTYTCACGDSYKADETDALPHTPDGNTDCTKETKCTVCGAVLKAAGDHTWNEGEITKEATCTQDGVKTYTCENCGETKTETIPAAHKWDEGKVTKEPTCTVKGVKTYTCSVCGKTKTEEIATVAHKYGSDGKCDVCGAAKPAGGGGGGGGGREYDITVEKSAHGTVTPEWDSAMKGDTVTLTVKPDKGYKLETLSVAGKGGSVVKVTEKNGVYSFDMPAYAVVVKATFVEENGSAVTNPFVDVKSDAYYYDAVLWAVQNGITGGKDATHFAPNETCTRAQAVTFLWRAAGSPAPKSAVNPFTDVKAGAYYYDAVLWAVENGITKGTTDTTFSPNATCSRAQIVTFLWRSQKSPAAGTVNPFTDVAAGAYYQNAVLWAVKNGITGGTTATTFSPNNNCTRAQIVTFLYRNVNG